jgi:hypothetical protein
MSRFIKLGNRYVNTTRITHIEWWNTRSTWKNGESKTTEFHVFTNKIAYGGNSSISTPAFVIKDDEPEFNTLKKWLDNNSENI